MSDDGQMSREQLLEVRTRVQRQLDILRTSGHSTPQTRALMSELGTILREIDAELADTTEDDPDLAALPADTPKPARATDQVFAHPRSWWDWLKET